MRRCDARPAAGGRVGAAHERLAAEALRRIVIIAIDGASTDLSLAVADPDGTLLGDDAWSSAQRQSAELLPHLLALLRAGRAAAARRDRRRGRHRVPARSPACGWRWPSPRGWPSRLRIPIVGVPSLEAWLEADPDAAAAVARAGAREAYLLARGDAGRASSIAMRWHALAAVVRRARRSWPTAFGLAAARRPRGAPAIARRAAERLAGRSGRRRPSHAWSRSTCARRAASPPRAGSWCDGSDRPGRRRADAPRRCRGRPRDRAAQLQNAVAGLRLRAGAARQPPGALRGRARRASGSSASPACG